MEPQLPPPYLRGIELFNAGAFFECHEVLEEIWLPAQGNERTFLHALIQTAAALHHYQQGNYKGALSVQQRACAKLASLPPLILQLDTQAFALDIQRFFAQALPSSEQEFPFPKIHLTPFFTYDSKA